MGSKPRIHVYTLCWNERLMLPYFLRHYEQFAERILVYDNGSDDGSQEIVRQHPQAELRFYDSGGQCRQNRLLDIKNHVWKESRGEADWVISCDTDELLYHPNLADYLQSCKRAGATLPSTTGFQMISEKFPSAEGQIYEEVNLGVHDARYSKHILFDPNAIEEINFDWGCHSARPQGKVTGDCDKQLWLLHFKYLGIEYMQTRYRELAARKSEFDKRRGFGHQYFWGPKTIEADFKKQWQQAGKLIV